MYRNQSFIGEQVFPVIPVAVRSDKYFQYNIADFSSASPFTANNRPASLRSPGAEAAEIDYRVSTNNYYCEEYAYRGIVLDAEVAIADDPLQPDKDQTLQLTERLMLDNELMIAKKAGNIAGYSATNKEALTTSSTGTSWAQYASANSNPFTDIRYGKLAVIHGCMREPNHMALSVNTARVLADHPMLKDLVKYTHQDALTTSGLPKVLRGLMVHEGAGQVNVSAEGAGYSGGNIWQASDGTDMALIYYSNTSPTLRSVSYGYTFEAPDDRTGARGISIVRYRQETRKGVLIEAAFMRDYRNIAIDSLGNAGAGYLITSCTV
jgi:hypothetical protein